eukprot:m.3307 g.3307  ORF g.3307 m.3307 type:complete len:504 (+) comp2732_c0_seq1:207-1718(+)
MDVKDLDTVAPFDTDLLLDLDPSDIVPDMDTLLGLPLSPNTMENNEFQQPPNDSDMKPLSLNDWDYLSSGSSPMSSSHGFPSSPEDFTLPLPEDLVDLSPAPGGGDIGLAPPLPTKANNPSAETAGRGRGRGRKPTAPSSSLNPQRQAYPQQKPKQQQRNMDVDSRPQKRSRTAEMDVIDDDTIPSIPSVEELAKQGLSKDEIKKHRRMLKNRQSASLSRRRKKEYLESLEGRNRMLTEENTKLKEALSKRNNPKEDLRKQKQKLEELEAENRSLRAQLEVAGIKPNTGSNQMHTGTALLVCLLCFGLFAGLGSPGGVSNSLSINTRVGRTLQQSNKVVPMLLEASSRNSLKQQPSDLVLPTVSNQTMPSQILAEDGHVLHDKAPEGIQTPNMTSVSTDKNQTTFPKFENTKEVSFVNNDHLMPTLSTYKLSGGFPSSVKEMISKTPKSSYVLCSECVFVRGSSPTALSLIMPSGKEIDSTLEQDSAFVKLDCEVSGTQVLRG